MDGGNGCGTDIPCLRTIPFFFDVTNLDKHIHFVLIHEGWIGGRYLPSRTLTSHSRHLVSLLPSRIFHLSPSLTPCLPLPSHRPHSLLPCQPLHIWQCSWNSKYRIQKVFFSHIAWLRMTDGLMVTESLIYIINAYRCMHKVENRRNWALSKYENDYYRIDAILKQDDLNL